MKNLDLLWVVFKLGQSQNNQFIFLTHYPCQVRAISPDLEKVASTQAVLGDTKTPQVPAGDTFWLAWINFLGLVTHIIIRDEKIKGICTCFHHIYTIMCLVHQIGLLCMVFVFWYQIMSRITLFFGQIFVANHAVLVTHFNP